jgi:hypothetical protein
MKSNRMQLNVKVFIAVIFFIQMAARSEPFALLASSNDLPTNLPALQQIEAGTNQSLPLIEMYDVPIRLGIENLARQANINYFIDLRLTKQWSSDIEKSPNDSTLQKLAKWWSSDSHTNPDPVLNFRWKNLTAKQALLQILKEHNLVLVENSITTVARITDTNIVADSVNFNLVGNDTNIIPLIVFKDVPITTGLKNLARQGVIRYTLDPKIGFGKPDQNGQIKVEPLLNFHWENLTAKQAFIAICENYNLLIVKNSATNGVRIESKD